MADATRIDRALDASAVDDPLVRLAAAQIAHARDDALAGCEMTIIWIRYHAADWLTLLTNDGERAEMLAWKMWTEVRNEVTDEAQLTQAD